MARHESVMELADARKLDAAGRPAMMSLKTFALHVEAEAVLAGLSKRDVRVLRESARRDPGEYTAHRRKLLPDAVDARAERFERAGEANVF